MYSIDENAVFFEFPNPSGESLAWVHIHVRVVDLENVTRVTEGIGE